MDSDKPPIVISRVVNAPRELVYRAFTDPEHLAAWWGPIGNSLPRDEMDFDVRPGGYQRWTEVFPTQPGLRVEVHIDLTDVVNGELIDGIAHVTGQLPEGIAPHETRMRVEFHDDADGRTRLEIRQWLPEQLSAPANQGWNEAFSKLDATLSNAQPVAIEV